MDFDKVLSLIVKEFDKEKINYALMGGFAMGIWGIMRSTMDLDFVVEYQAISKVEKIMKKYGYRCVHKTENISQYVSDMRILGEIDFLHAFRKISLSMLKRAKELPIFEGKFKIRVLEPEDIIGLKLQALANNKSREIRDYADIASILDYFKGKLDWSIIKDYFLLFDKEKKFKELKAKYGTSK